MENFNTSVFDSPVYRNAIMICVGTASCLSILGAGLVIVTFFAYPELRTILRQIILNISISDLICAVTNLVGISINFYNYVDGTPQQFSSSVYHYVCVVQAACRVFGTDASILWIMGMAVYMFVVVVVKRPQLGDRQLPAYYIICWGLPAVITCVFGGLGWLGFEPFTTPGWCDIRATLPLNSSNNSTYTVVPVVIRYTLFLYISFIILPPMFIAIRCSLSRMVRKLISLIAYNHNNGWLQFCMYIDCSIKDTGARLLAQDQMKMQ